MKFGVVVAGIPNPASTGSALTGWSVTQSLLDAGHHVTVFSLLDGGPADVAIGDRESRLTALKDLGADAVQVPVPAERPTRAEIVRKSLWPSLNVFYPTASVRPALGRLLTASRPDAVFAYHFDALAAVSGLTHVPRMGIVGDPTHLVVLHRWWFMRKRPTPRHLLTTWLALMAALRLPQMQRRLLCECRACGAFAAHHAGWFRKQGVRECRYFRTPIVDTVGSRWESLRRSVPKAERPKILMVGHLHGIATLTGLKFFATQILPSLEQKLGENGFEVHIVGRYAPGPSLASRLARPSVRLRGYVEDIGAEFLSADVLLVPIPIRLGIRARILTGFTYGCCVVAHQSNAFGIPELAHEDNVLLAKGGADIAEEIVRAVRDPDLRRRLGTRGRQTYERCFTPEAAGRPIVEELEAIARFRGKNASCTTGSARAFMP